MNGVTAGIVQHKGFLISIILKRKNHCCFLCRIPIIIKCLLKREL